ncbi:toxin-antitoxin system YwqK family antitoxin [Fusobacterium hominis]|uniref:toxin-antitoxin system YwqK family antitoxin n=1 Tax=Fusobacterium hominis TaxID=2764326 RepID=UPI0015A0691D|nr:toxin-antitoxin system YwqK family antitoxin [Fusobacterium hominis]
MRKITTFLLTILAGAAIYAEEFKEIAPLDQIININVQKSAPKKEEPKVEKIDEVKKDLEEKKDIKVTEEKPVKVEKSETVKVDIKPEMTKDKISGRVLDLAEKRMVGDVAYANDEQTPYTGTFALFLGDFIEYTETFKNGVLEGPKTWYSEEGNIVLQEYYKNNKIEGEQKAYYENGAIKSIVDYKNNRVLGITAYAKDGKVLHQDNFKNGTGVWKYFWENGKVLEEGHYKNWVKDGVWKKYRENGEIDTVTEYKNGKQVDVTWQ